MREAIRLTQGPSEGHSEAPMKVPSEGHSEAPMEGPPLRTEVHRPLDTTQVVREDVEVHRCRKGRCMRVRGDTGERGSGAT